MSDEEEGLIEEHVQKLGPKFPVIRAPKGMSTYGGRFYPSTFTIGPDGQILTVPDDHMPGEAFLEEQLAGVSLAPKLPDDPRFDAVRQFWNKRDHKKLAEYLDRMLAQEKLSEDLRTVFVAQREELDRRIERQVARVAKLGEGPDYSAASNALEKLAKDWKGLAPEAAAEKELERFGKDPQIKKELAAGKALEKLLSGFDTTRLAQARKLLDELPKFVKRYEGTHAAKRATDLRSQLAEQVRGG